MATPTTPSLQWPVCSLLLFAATPAEETAIEEEAHALQLPLQKDATITTHFRELGFKDTVWKLGPIGAETVLVVGCSRVKGRVVMGPYGRLGSAAKGLRYLAASGAQGIIQVGMAFGASRVWQELGDVLVSSSLVPYDSRDVKPSNSPPGYSSDYSETRVEPARSALVERCRRQQQRKEFAFGVHIGAILSGAARIHATAFRDELIRTVPHGTDPIVGGEMEGVGLLAADVKADDPAWCVVKGISDFADERRDDDIVTGRKVAPRNAAKFVLCSLINDAKDLG